MRVAGRSPGRRAPSCRVPATAAEHATLRGRIKKKRRRVMRLQVAVLCATALGLFASSALAQRPSGGGPERRAAAAVASTPPTPAPHAGGGSLRDHDRAPPPSPPRREP